VVGAKGAPRAVVAAKDEARAEGCLRLGGVEPDSSCAAEVGAGGAAATDR
jgi:hypothetical protein